MSIELQKGSPAIPVELHRIGYFPVRRTVQTEVSRELAVTMSRLPPEKPILVPPRPANKGARAQPARKAKPAANEPLILEPKF
jgi:hypothetical protein